MKILFQFALTVLVGFGSLYAGVMNFYSPADVLTTYYAINIDTFNEGARLAIESQVRLLSGMWVAAAIAIFTSVTQFEKHGHAIRWILVGMAIGAVGEALTVFALGGDHVAAAIKATVQITIYLGLELWRWFLVRKMTAITATNS